MKSAFGQVGALRPAQARSAMIRHPGAMHFWPAHAALVYPRTSR
jgi:hypothetical protein